MMCRNTSFVTCLHPGSLGSMNFLGIMCVFGNFSSEISKWFFVGGVTVKMNYSRF